LTGVAGFAVAGRKGMCGCTTWVKLRKTGFDDVVVDPAAAVVEPAEAPPALAPDEPELPDDPDELEELDELDELLPPLVEVLDVDPAFVLEVLLLEAGAAAAPPLEPPWPPDALAPLAPCPEADPLVLLFPAVVPPWLPPTDPSRASTWLRTVVLFALSIDPVSTT